MVSLEHATHAEARTGAISNPDDIREIQSLAEAREAIDDCRRCPLYKAATQAVFGEGPARADILFVGEQPGDQEDLSGKPFVGPAGRVFDTALERVGIARDGVFVTNAVKHFKFVPRGKKRLHKRPDADEIAACRFWLELEMTFVRPKVVVALGATAARSVLGKAVTISRLRGEAIIREDAPAVFVTVHPSYLLRIPDRTDAQKERRRFEADLVRIRDYARTH